MSARRSLLTAAAAGAVLFGLWFVPSANATVEDGRTAQEQLSQQTQHGEAGQRSAAAGSKELRLADTGSVDTTPYLLGGTAFLGFGAALVAAASHRSRRTTAV